MAELPLQEMELGGYWTSQPLQMRSARGMISEKTWIKHIGKSGRIWLQPYGETENSMIIADGWPGSQGFGGGKHKFTLHTGEVIELEGPWSSNHDAFFEETGIDLRNRHRTWGCIGRHREYYPSKYEARPVICDLLYWDPPEGVVGSFNRIREIAKQLAYERDELVFAFSGSLGGSSCGVEFPFQHSEEYRAYRQNTGRSKLNWDYWRKQQDAYWEKYRVEFRSPLEEYRIGGPTLQVVPLDEELELNPPPPPKPVIYDEYDEDGERYY